ncbi:MAG: hypothetical protein J4431_02700 [Candidatus Aenigmarchaeota archaeon]|nr:hypothetical protein [Candidatus Aenigmarchaeota archaeon]
MKYPALLIICVLAAGCVQPDFEYNGYHFAKYGENIISATGEKTVYFNPSNMPGYAPKADYIFFSYDDCDKSAAEQLKRNDTRIIGPLNCVAGMTGSVYSMADTDKMSFSFGETSIRSFPAAKGGMQGNAYLVTTDGMAIYYNDGETAGPVNATVDIAFLSHGAAANTIKPKIAVPLADAAEFKSALEGTGIEVRAI